MQCRSLILVSFLLITTASHVVPPEEGFESLSGESSVTSEEDTEDSAPPLIPSDKPSEEESKEEGSNAAATSNGIGGEGDGDDSEILFDSAHVLLLPPSQLSSSSLAIKTGDTADGGNGEGLWPTSKSLGRPSAVSSFGPSSD